MRLDGNAITGMFPATLVNLLSLEVLDLGDNQLGGNVPATIGNMGALRKLRTTFELGVAKASATHLIANILLSFLQGN